jgi:hypothetical protein
MLIEVTHTAPVRVGTTQITLPHYYISGDYTKFYCCMTEDMKLIQVYAHKYACNIETKSYDDEQDIAFRLEREMRDKLYEPIDEAVFMHKFSEAHREIFYVANPKLKPIE